MDSFNPTTKTQAALTSALQAASAAGNPEIRPAHLLLALLTQNDGIAAPLLEAVGVVDVDCARVRGRPSAESARRSAARVAGGDAPGDAQPDLVHEPAVSRGAARRHRSRRRPRGHRGGDPERHPVSRRHRRHGMRFHKYQALGNDYIVMDAAVVPRGSAQAGKT